MKFPDTSINALALLFLAGLATGIAGMTLEVVLGEPSSNLGEVVVTVAAFFIGFGLVYGLYAAQAYRQSAASNPASSER